MTTRDKVRLIVDSVAGKGSATSAILINAWETDAALSMSSGEPAATSNMYSSGPDWAMVNRILNIIEAFTNAELTTLRRKVYHTWTLHLRR